MQAGDKTLDIKKKYLYIKDETTTEKGQKMTYKKLNETLKKELIKKVEEIEIDVSELDSYHWDKNPYCVEPQLVGTSGCSVWDENEEWQEQIKKMKKFLQDDGAGEYLNLADEDWDNQDEYDCTTLTNECINYLSTLEN